MATRGTTTLMAWLCMALVALAAVARPGMVLCVSQHGHVAVEVNCDGACENGCTEACHPAAGPTADGTDGPCRDLPVEFDLTTLQQREAKTLPAAIALDLPVAILEMPVALINAAIGHPTPRESTLRPVPQLSALRVTILQI
ncbi:MAG: hypothetical protein J0L78_08435 [Planctomycetes bacterium]|nr:hypothetical protein [Planctomycetota bacterium]